MVRDRRLAAFLVVFMVAVGLGPAVTAPAGAQVDPYDAPGVLVTSPLTGLSAGDTITVSYNPTKPMPASDPDAGITRTPLHFVGVCSAFFIEYFEFPLNSDLCIGVDLPLDGSGGTVELQADRTPFLDCAVPDSCVLGYYYGYDQVTDDGGADIIDLHRTARPISFAQSPPINSGNPTAVVGEEVSVEFAATPAGPAGSFAFVMACALDGGGLASLFCDPSFGTVELDYDGTFSGSITMPATVSSGDRQADCTTGRGCVIAFAVVGPGFSTVYGFGHWVRGQVPAGGLG